MPWSCPFSIRYMAFQNCNRSNSIWSCFFMFTASGAWQKLFFTRILEIATPLTVRCGVTVWPTLTFSNYQPLRVDLSISLMANWNEKKGWRWTHTDCWTGNYPHCQYFRASSLWLCVNPIWHNGLANFSTTSIVPLLKTSSPSFTDSSSNKEVLCIW